MDSVLDQIGEWLKELLVSGIMNQLTGLFDSVNTQVGDIATQVGTTPANFSPGVFAMIRNVSESVIIPVAGLILTFIACYELIQMIIDHNNLANFETWIFFKWVFKTFVAVTLITNTFNIVMAVFDVTQHVINNAGGLIAGNTAVDAAALETMQDTLEAMEIGPLFALFLQCMVVQFTIKALSVVIFVIVYGRMIEIYLMTSMAPIPFSTFGNREQSMVGQNYLRSLFALGFQGFLIMICVGIYAVLIQSVSISDDIIGSIWGILGYTVDYTKKTKEDSFMWLIKLPFRILALPIMAIVAVLSIFYSLALNLSAIVAGLVYLVLGVCIVMLLFQHAWIYAALLFGFAVLVFLAIMFAEAVSLGLEALTGKLSKFIFS